MILKFDHPIECLFTRRYKRFFADIMIENKKRLAHCVHTGPMTGITLPCPAIVSLQIKATRKLTYTLEAVQKNNLWIGVNTHNPNKVFSEILKKRNLIQYLHFYDSWRSNAKVESNILDFALYKQNKIFAYIEIKHIHWVENNIGFFPGAVTTRGRKQLINIQRLNLLGYKTYIIYVVQREKCHHVKIAQHIDNNYFVELKKAYSTGSKIFGIECAVSQNQIEIKSNKIIQVENFKL